MTDKIYLSGPIEQANDPERWREDIQQAVSYGNIHYLNPYGNCDGDSPKETMNLCFKMMSKADGVLVHYEHETPSYGTAMEVIVASQWDIPVVVWTDRFSGGVENTPQSLQFFADDFRTRGRPAVNRLLELM